MTQWLIEEACTVTLELQEALAQKLALDEPAHTSPELALEYRLTEIAVRQLAGARRR